MANHFLKQLFDELEQLEQIREEETKIKKNINAIKIKNAISQSKQKQKNIIEFLNVMCSNAGQCIAFGKENLKIKRLFSNFNSFHFVTEAKQIGTNGDAANGFVIELKNVTQQYIAYTVLKMCQNDTADSLVYEYTVGREFVNQQLNFFPCFIETYSLFLYPPTKYAEIKNHITSKKGFNSNIFILKSGAQNVSKTVKPNEMCQFSQNFAILIQHLHDVLTLSEFLDKFIYYTISEEEILYILYQIYLPLSVLSGVFTHYDLHWENVLLYQPFNNNGRIHFKYHLPDGEIVEFYSRYLVKIIDYGRCYYYSNDTSNSKTIYNKICDEPECSNEQNTCGYDKGFRFLKPGLIPKHHFISSSEPNISADLRLLLILIHSHSFRSEDVKQYLHKLNGFKITRFSTDPLASDITGQKINNVIDAEKLLRPLCRKKHLSNLYNVLKVKGIMEIYADRTKPLTFKLA